MEFYLALTNLIISLAILGMNIYVYRTQIKLESGFKKLHNKARNLVDFPTGKLELCPVCQKLSDTVQRVPSGHLACKNCRVKTFNLTA